MQIPHTALPPLRLSVIVAFGLLCAVVFGYLWTNSGGRIPLITTSTYEVDVPLTDSDNLVQLGDVMVAGVKVGTVRSVDVAGPTATAHVELEGEVVPLHEGATATVKNKTLIEETYLQLVDGTGPELPSGSSLPPGAVTSSVQVDDVLASLDPQTRDSLGSLIRGGSAATAGRKDDVGATVGGLGDVGREGSTSLVALSEQSDDLRSLLVSSSDLMKALDTRQGQLADLVQDSNTVFGAVAESRKSTEEIVHRLPPVLDTAQQASGSLQELSGSLAPVAGNLARSAPELSGALQELPQTSADLRGLLPSLDRTLDRAPETLTRVPTIARDVRDLVPTTQVALSDVNPTLAFVAPYGHDVAAFFTNFAQVLGVSGDQNGQMLRTYFILNEQTPNKPLDLNHGPLAKSNPVPEAGSAHDPAPGGPTGWRRVERDQVPG